ncbi:DUF3145 domain-containing protein [Arsenicicoccus piscis]|uniref:DUF3145 domain-containing protein n=1 Tax=Arsenicicoccus piscis TaxID=673954 RepID=A0ABQ6HPB8_9MICO|nr:DUF3145 domain-containing protein [Arsenicicoccus piscis]MCH8628438.1 DUF3145 domain-containing protein [Arsenicicoccus piscis]GMA20002.1 hypothetical protein GCM10025862_20230 [Arsenicicoccus piscis]
MSTAENLHRSATTPTTRGVVFIHSASTALCPHVAWALEGVLGTTVTLDWEPQPLGDRAQRTEINWVGPQGTGAAIASALRGWDSLRYEITEEPSAGADGSRWSFTPSLGLHHTWVGASGDSVVNEDRIRHAVAQAQGDPLVFADLMDGLLGTRWDEELEGFRHAGEDAPVRWLYKVG